MKPGLFAYTGIEVIGMILYLGDNDTAFEAALREDASVKLYYDSLPGMLRERVRAAGLYSPQEIGAYIDSLVADGN